MANREELARRLQPVTQLSETADKTDVQILKCGSTSTLNHFICYLLTYVFFLFALFVVYNPYKIILLYSPNYLIILNGLTL